ncbi:sugar phosphate isomerase/epimerase family protein [Cohnella hashimotonis]|uniref:Xylose isomerase n=1 Tax=Cohnella hashimotonis TaxID=2826895 RepID=A0ABT6TDR2_9BACL|nr:sugar phosphate isomerase/epimerase family protein [Cohnella hashimotonis]MDI4644485.1 sugar phosphate isomerase/epimerase family protein [Cohnella hashimotonis]
MNKYAVILGNLGNTRDRFLSSGYKDQPDQAAMLRQAAEIDGIQGVELVGSWDITDSTVEEVGDLLDKNNLQCVSIIPDLFAQKRWGGGSFAAKSASVREQALEETMKMAELARKLKCPLINVWPGQDGYDYPLQGNFPQERAWLQEGLAKACAAYPDLRFSLEYKVKEPRTHSYLARAADTLLTAVGTALPNVGVTIDTGHSIMAGENMADAAVLLQQTGNRLFHMHFNDNYRAWDDDMIVGSIHFVEYIELLYWLKTTGYEGWYSMDQYPYREDGQGAVRESVRFLQGIERMLDDAAMDEIGELIREGNAVKSTAWFRSKVFNLQ